jgi:hypothetical protein
MKRARLELGAAPADEPCAQLSTAHYDAYAARAMLEIAVYRRQTLRAIEGAGRSLPPTVRIERHHYEHEFGPYYELAVTFPVGDDEAEAFAFWLEGNVPANWDEVALAELVSFLEEVLA